MSRSDACRAAWARKRAAASDGQFRTDAELRWRAMASRCVRLAIQIGWLPALDGTVVCVDCGEPAICYDHRDYSRPIAVDAVCRSCNTKRGKGVMPSIGNCNTTG